MTDVPTPIRRLDYRPTDFTCSAVRLRVELASPTTLVHSELDLARRVADADGDLVLNAEDLSIRSLAVDGVELAGDRWNREGDLLTVSGLPTSCTLSSTVAIEPDANTQLSGLYRTGGLWCTQCEAEGFRRITPFLDRPDVMSRYRCTVIADPAEAPILLSNGDRVEEGSLDDGRHFVTWEDPHLKPSYLFALVAGDLKCHGGEFTTASGRKVSCEIWVEPENIDKCEHALVSLQKSMAWDETTYGREYDLDTYMIVAVKDFNMGAMENKGLNVFNAKYVLASPETATDGDYEGIESVIAHEYFHNWTGNRVTCRDWFQLTLKEGLTVFRDQQFSGDMNSQAVQRIDDVRILRGHQFAEDSGPMAHPIRPEEYVAMDNFYTATVYNKGAEVIRCYHSLLGVDGFRKGMDLYFERHDGQAVTCDDFRAAMADANGKDLTVFERWYDQAGTPDLHAALVWDAANGSATLTLRQDRKPLAGHPEPQPWHVPVRLGLLGRSSGKVLPVTLDPAQDGQDEVVLELTEASATWTFSGLEEEPLPSLLRNFSAPVRLHQERSDEDLVLQMSHDPDPFNRWDAGQALARDRVLAAVSAIEGQRPVSLDSGFSEAFGRVIAADDLDNSLKALALTLPGENELAQALTPMPVEALHEGRSSLLRQLAEQHEAALLATYQELHPTSQSGLEGPQGQARRLKNTCLALLMQLGDRHLDLALAQAKSATLMTDRLAAVAAAARFDLPEAKAAVAAFHTDWQADPLVLDKWFTLQVVADRPDAVECTKALAEHPDFTHDNPNRVRSVFSALSAGNHAAFHRADGAGYALIADEVILQNTRNPQLASRLATAFNPWKRYDSARQELIRSQLERIRGTGDLSKDLSEIVERALA
jgi:aminopeptidase N